MAEPVKRRVGRPTKATRARMDAILNAIRGGNTLTNASRIAGVHRDTRLEWEHKYPAFSGEIEEALAKCEAACVATILLATRTDWRAAAWMLTHGPRRADWAEVQKRELSGPDGKAIPVEASVRSAVDLSRYSDDQLEVLEGILADAADPGGGSGGESAA